MRPHRCSSTSPPPLRRSRIPRRVLLPALVAGALLAAAPPAMAGVSLDPAFGGDGRVVTGVGAHTSGVREVVRTTSGYVYAYGQAGMTLNGRVWRLSTVARYFHDGTPDPSWDGNGLAYGNDVLGAVPSEGGIVVHGDGSVTVASASSSGQIVLERFTSSGRRDSGFGSGGARIHTLPSGARAWIVGIARQSSGKLVVAGHVEHNGRRLFVARYNADGSVDSGFGTRELGPGTSARRIAPSGSEVEASVTSLAVDRSDRILVGGYHLGSTRNAAFVYRFSSGGGAGAVSAWNFYSGTTAATHSDVTDIAVNDDGQIAVSGNALFGGRSQAAVARLRSDLSLDPGFAHAGRRVLSYGSSGSTGLTVGWGPHEWVYVGGASWNTSAAGTDTRFAVTRLRYNGAYDAAFDGDGRIVTDFAGTTEVVRSLFVHPLTDLPIVAGSAAPGGTVQFALARYADVG